MGKLLDFTEKGANKLEIIFYLFIFFVIFAIIFGFIGGIVGWILFGLFIFCSIVTIIVFFFFIINTLN